MWDRHGKGRRWGGRMGVVRWCCAELCRDFRSLEMNCRSGLRLSEQESHLVLRDVQADNSRHTALWLALLLPSADGAFRQERQHPPQHLGQN